MIIKIKVARKQDCMFIARGICMALHNEPDEGQLEKIASICRMDNVLYSYRHCMIAWAGDQPAGICLCYDGGKYHEMRLTTFSLFKQCDISVPEEMEDEAKEGEYYIDSLAVMPEFRRMGIARRLIKAQLLRAQNLGYTKATLLVDPENPIAQALYRSFGFVDDCTVNAFGQDYLKWKKMLLTTDLLRKRFIHFNELIFDNKLPILPIQLSKARTYLGILSFKRKRTFFGTKKEYNFKIRISTYWIQSDEMLNNTLVHEMIHYYIHINHLKDTSTHGQLFRDMMKRINQEYGMNITISHKRTQLTS